MHRTHRPRSPFYTSAFPSSVSFVATRRRLPDEFTDTGRTEFRGSNVTIIRRLARMFASDARRSSTYGRLTNLDNWRCTREKRRINGLVDFHRGICTKSICIELAASTPSSLRLAALSTFDPSSFSRNHSPLLSLSHSLLLSLSLSFSLSHNLALSTYTVVAPALSHPKSLSSKFFNPFHCLDSTRGDLKVRVFRASFARVPERYRSILRPDTFLSLTVREFASMSNNCHR